MSPGVPRRPLLLATTNGYGFATALGDMVSRQKAGKQFITVDDDAEPLRPQLVKAESDRSIACLSGKGRVLVFDATEIKALSGGGRGVTLMDLDDGEKLLAALPLGGGRGRAGDPWLGRQTGRG